MPSPLTHHAYKLNKYINKRLYQGPTYWDEDSMIWKMEPNWRKLIPYYIFNYFFLNIILVVLALIIFSIIVYIPDALPFEKSFIFVLFIMTIPYCISVDILFHIYGSDVLQIVNWIDEQRDQHFRTQQTQPWKLGSPGIFLHGTIKIHSNLISII
ncbi:unnamed protein product [Orchesella dallaii]|uniref:Uncharacterized protein n=1 Tax=Orchesella dallaii TaxID=48710 RepID=A0ABP1RPI9_9HEXA